MFLVILLASSLFLIPQFREFFERRFNQTLEELVFEEGEGETLIGVFFIFHPFIRGLESPIIGHGWGTWPNYGWKSGLSTRSVPGPTYVEGATYEVSGNRFGQIFYGAGIIGLLAYLIWQFSLFRLILRSQIPLPYRVAFLSLAAGMMWGHDMFRAVTAYPPLYWFLGLACAMGRVFPYNEKMSLTLLKG